MAIVNSNLLPLIFVMAKALIGKDSINPRLSAGLEDTSNTLDFSPKFVNVEP